MNEETPPTRPPAYVRPIRLRTRILAVAGLLLGAIMIVSAVRGGLVLRGMAGVFFIAVSAYWAFASNKPDSLAVANARLRAAKAALEREQEREHERESD